MHFWTVHQIVGLPSRMVTVFFMNLKLRIGLMRCTLMQWFMIYPILKKLSG